MRKCLIKPFLNLPKSCQFNKIVLLRGWLHNAQFLILFQVAVVVDMEEEVVAEEEVEEAGVEVEEVVVVVEDVVTEEEVQVGVVVVEEVATTGKIRKIYAFFFF